jgi:TPR repeat protein
MSTMLRCPEGHVFAAEGAMRCPVCGAAVGVSTGPTDSDVDAAGEEKRQLPLVEPDRLPLLLAGGSAAIIGLLLAGWLLWPASRPAPTPDPEPVRVATGADSPSAGTTATGEPSGKRQAGDAGAADKPQAGATVAAAAGATADRPTDGKPEQNAAGTGDGPAVERATSPEPVPAKPDPGMTGNSTSGTSTSTAAAANTAEPSSQQRGASLDFGPEDHPAMSGGGDKPADARRDHGDAQAQVPELVTRQGGSSLDFAPDDKATAADNNPGGSATTDRSATLPAVDYPGPVLQAVQAALGLSDLVIDNEAYYTIDAAMKVKPTPRHLALLLTLAERGYVPAKVLAAYAYLRGDGVPRNSQLGLRYLQETAEAGYPPSCLNVARLLQQGEWLPKDEARARELLARAARAADPMATNELVVWGITAQEVGPTARDVLNLAYSGNAKTPRLARALLDDKVAVGGVALAFYAIRWSRDKSLKAQVPALTEAAVRAGAAEAYQIEAKMLREGIGVKKNATEALLWLQRYRGICGDAPGCKYTDTQIEEVAAGLDPARLQPLRDAFARLVAGE